MFRQVSFDNFLDFFCKISFKINFQISKRKFIKKNLDICIKKIIYLFTTKPEKLLYGWLYYGWFLVINGLSLPQTGDPIKGSLQKLDMDLDRRTNLDGI
jgi:hypothetical protein